MKIELRKFSHSERQSEETNCFVADVYVDGKKALEVRNAGHGGGNEYHEYIPGMEQRVIDFCRSLPPLQDERFGPMDMDIDLYIDGLVTELLLAKDKKKEVNKLAKELKTRTFYTYSDRNGVFTAKGIWTLEKVQKQIPTVNRVLNDLTPEALYDVILQEQKKQDLAKA